MREVSFSTFLHQFLNVARICASDFDAPTGDEKNSVTKSFRCDLIPQQRREMIFVKSLDADKINE
jgi:hypothetical protein